MSTVFSSWLVTLLVPGVLVSSADVTQEVAPQPVAQPQPVQPQPQPQPTQPQPAQPQPAQPAPVAAQPSQPLMPAPATQAGPPPPTAASAPEELPLGTRPEHGPFFADDPVSEVKYPSGPDTEKPPFLSLRKGAFCFIEDAKCKSALLASAHVAVGMNVLRGDFGFTTPYTQFGFRGGFTVRPLWLARGAWSPWGLGLVASWSRGSGQFNNPNSLIPGAVVSTARTSNTDSFRIAAVNQFWLGRQRLKAFHLDVTLGAVQSTSLGVTGTYWGTHVEVAGGFGGWGALFAMADFLDGDTRVTFGLRAHAIPAAPVAALVILGMLASGAFAGGGE